MKLRGEHRFEAPREQVWECLLDPEVLARTLPGVEKLERTGEGEYAGALDIRIGPVRGRFDGGVTLSNLQAPDSYDLRLRGRGAPGFVDGKGSVELAEDGEATVMRYDLDLQVGGRIAGVGQRLLDSTSRALSQEALVSLGNQIQARAAGAAGGDSATVADAAAAVSGDPGGSPDAGSEPGAPRTALPDAPSQAQVAARVARAVAADAIPGRGRVLLFAGAVAVVVVAIVLLRSCAG